MLRTATLHLRLASAGAARPASPLSALYTLASRQPSIRHSSTATLFSASHTTLPRRTQPTQPATLLRRFASISNSPTPSPTSTAASSSSASTQSSGQQLTWNSFLHLRRIRRYYNLSSSLLTALASTFLGMSLLAQQNLQQLGQQMFGLDPFIVIGVWTVGFAGAGWLLGPLVGGGVFRVVYRGVQGEMGAKERDFFARIRKYRVDPTSSSMQNPVPDYYGEKITSVAGYRNWLKDQRAFNKKRGRSFV